MVTVAGRVIVLSRDRRLATIAGGLLDFGEALTCFSSPAELPDWLHPPVDAVVLDFPRRSRGIVYRQLRQRYHGPVLALLDPGEVQSGLPPNRGRLAVLHRPFSGEELSASLGKLVGAPTPSGGPGGKVPHVVATAAGGTPAPATPATPAGTATPAARGGVAPPTGAAARAARHRTRAWRRLDPLIRRRVKGWAVGVGVTALLLVGISLSGGSGCRSAGAGCTNVAGAVESGGLGGNPGPTTRPLGSHTAPPGLQPVASTKGSPTQPADPPGSGMQLPIASGVGDLIAGTSSSSGGAPLLVVTGGSGSSPPPSGGSGGTTSPTTTQPPATVAPTTAPPVTAAPTTEPPTTAPPPTEPPTTAPPTTEPPTTAPPTTEPPTTEPPTTAPPTTEPPTTAPPATDPATTTAA